MKRRKIHDGIVGLVVTAGVVLGHYMHPAWLWVPVILGVALIQSGITGFCPLYAILNKCIHE